MNVKFLEAPMCSILLSTTREETESLKREEVCRRPLRVIAAGLGLGHDCPDSQCSFIQFAKAPSLQLWVQFLDRYCEQQRHLGMNLQKHKMLAKSRFQSHGELPERVQKPHFKDRNWSSVGSRTTETSLDNKVNECIAAFTEVEARKLLVALRNGRFGMQLMG